MLEGVSEVFKHFQTSKLASAGLLAATSTLVVGPRFNDAIPRVPDGWNWLVWAVMIFTGVQCAWWLICGIGTAMRSSAQAVGKTFARPVTWAQLNDDDRMVLGLAGKQGGYFAPDQVNHYNITLSQVAADLAMRRLNKLGLMAPGLMGSHLTDEGKEFFLRHFQQPSRQP